MNRKQETTREQTLRYPVRLQTRSAAVRHHALFGAYLVIGLVGIGLWLPSGRYTVAHAEVGQIVNINSATADELTRLPGIGAGKAEHIIAYRTRHKFRRIQEIMRVKGIGRKLFGRIRKLITIKGTTTLQPKVKAKRPNKRHQLGRDCHEHGNEVGTYRRSEGPRGPSKG